MPGWIENRLYALEQRVEYLMRLLQDLLPQLRSAQQNARNAFAQWNPGGGSGGASVYVCVLGAALPAGTAPAGGAPGSLAAQTIYRIADGGASYTTVGTATVYNPYLSAGTSGRIVTVIPNPDGSYTAIGQSCT
jgi:hypothetical protein